MRAALILIAAGAAEMVSCGGPAGGIQRALNRASGSVVLPPGVTEIRSELRLPVSAHDLEITGGEGTILKAAPGFQGRGLIVIRGGQRIRMRNFILDGNRGENERPTEMPPAASTFTAHFLGNGIAVEDAQDLAIENVEFREIYGFAVVASRVKKIKIGNVRVQDSGGRNARGRNNTSGGILLEEGTEDFEVRDSLFRRVLGNGVWTHSTFQSPRNARGLIAGNRFEILARDAIQVGHANRVRVENNQGRMIGYPPSAVDVEHQGTPVAIDTAGKVDEGVYTRNKFEEVNGKCFDLDGFHDGEVSGNSCINRGQAADYPFGHYGLVMNNSYKEMESQLITIRDNVFDGFNFGGIFMIGKGHKILRNKLLNLNKKQCGPDSDRFECPVDPDNPSMLYSGIYLAYKAERRSPAEENVIEDNHITGHGMKTNCIAASPRVNVSTNTIRNNTCNTP